MVIMNSSITTLGITREFALAPLTISLLALFCQPAIADSTPQTTTPQGSAKVSVFDRIGKIVAKTPKAAASFLVASVGGIPISAVRHSADEMKHAAKEMVHGLKDPLTAPFFLVVGPEAVLFAGLAGVVVGPSDAVETSAVHCFTKPFSKEAFSVGPMEK